MKGEEEKAVRLQVTILINLLSVLVVLNISLRKKNDEETFFNSHQTE